MSYIYVYIIFLTVAKFQLIFWYIKSWGKTKWTHSGQFKIITIISVQKYSAKGYSVYTDIKN